MLTKPLQLRVSAHTYAYANCFCQLDSDWLQVHSRIENFDKFERTISDVGFLKKAEDKSNRMFVLYEFERLTGRPLSDLERQTLSVAELKPCIYKRR